MSWGKGIVVAFISFVVFIGTLATLCFRENVSLVSTKYYEDDLRYQQAYDKIQNTTLLNEQPEIKMDRKTLSIQYKSFKNIDKGMVTITRPSNEKLDFHFNVSNSQDSLQEFVLENTIQGLYKIRFEWKEGTQEFRIDKTIVI